jgi:hypothetical protein
VFPTKTQLVERALAGAVHDNRLPDFTIPRTLCLAISYPADFASYKLLNLCNLAPYRHGFCHRKAYAGTLPYSALLSLVKALYHVTSRLSELWRAFYCAPPASLSYIVSLSSNSIIYPPIGSVSVRGYQESIQLSGAYATRGTS